VDDDGDLVVWVRVSLRAHLRAAPHTADTIEGIASFWLPPEGRGIRRDLLERALDDLVAEGVLVSRRLPDGALLYCGAASAGGEGEPER
jgi:hypothetical protein